MPKISSSCWTSKIRSLTLDLLLKSWKKRLWRIWETWAWTWAWVEDLDSFEVDLFALSHWRWNWSVWGNLLKLATISSNWKLILRMFACYEEILKENKSPSFRAWLLQVTSRDMCSSTCTVEHWNWRYISPLAVKRKGLLIFSFVFCLISFVNCS
jgi:hypothetical protein